MSGALTPRRPWRDRRVVLGVAGGIAAYKVAQLARDLTQLGATVDVVLTRAAREFVGAITFEALTGRPVVGDMHDPGGALEHIRLAREADVVCIAPATADLLARAAAGHADDMITAILLATKAPVLLCPAMNDRMYSHPQTQLNLLHLAEVCGYRIVGPAVGPLAYGEGEGPGRLEDTRAILDHIGRAVSERSRLTGRRVVVTAGPSREPLDPVRFLSNRSSGRMGYALAAAAWRRGAEVVLVSGPTMLDHPVGPEVRRIETAEEMRSAVKEEIAGADALIMSAAVADFRPARPANRKIKKDEDASLNLELEYAPDVLKTTCEARPQHMIVVGFALETDNARENAVKKLQSKGLDLVVLNEAMSPGSGFEVETNQVVILGKDGSEEALPLLPKDEVAERILDRLAELLPPVP